MKSEPDADVARPDPGLWRAWAALCITGVAWGTTQPLSRIAMETGHHPIGVALLNAVICLLLLVAILVLRGNTLPVTRRHLGFYLACGFLGTALPNGLSFQAYTVLPVGIVSMVIACVPMATLLLAWLMRVERPDRRRQIGLCLGLAAMAMLALPESSLPQAVAALWLILPMVVVCAYAAENVYIAMARPPGLDALTVLTGLFAGAVLLLLPVAAALDAWVDPRALGPAERAIAVISVLHILAYGGFVWLIGRAGPVFASQTGYIVTATGVLGGMLAFGEQHSEWVWLALATLFVGLTLVRPRNNTQDQG
ncbi:MAG: DMT family transporter [Pseudomonadota bacterium]